MYRQGDVLIVPVTRIKGNPAPNDSRGVVLAEGEATGHHHRIGPSFRSAKLFNHEEGTYLRVNGKRAAPLTHEEHKTIMIPPGSYKVIRQREYSPEAVRQVVD